MYKIVLFILSCVAYNISNAQLSPFQEVLGDKQEIVFDTSGKMIFFPKTFVTKKTRLIFKVNAPSHILEPWWSLLQNKLNAAQQFYNSPQNRPLYDCFFKAKIDNYDKEITSILALDTTKICDKKQFENLKASFKKTPHPDLIPIESFLDNIINQYIVRIYKNGNCIRTVPLTPQMSCGNDCIHFVDETNAAGIKIDDLQCSNCDADGFDQLKFELVHYDPLKKTIRDWFTKKATDLKNNNPNLRRDVAQAINDNKIEDFLYNKDYLKGWFLNWFWFNGGKIQLDPFEVLTVEGKGKLLKEIGDKQSIIDDAKNEVSLIDSAGKRITVFDEFGNFMNERSNQKSNLKSAEDIKATDENLLKNKLFNDFNTYNVSYQGFLKPSASFLRLSARSVNPQKQFDAFKKFQRVNIGLVQKSKIKEIPENEHVYLAIHNIPKSVNVRIDEKQLNFDDQEEFTKLLNEQLPKFDFSSLTNLKSVQDLLASFASSSGQGAKGLEGKQLNFVVPFVVPCQVPKLEDIASALKNGFITFPANESLFSQLVASDPFYKTQLNPLTNFEAPFRDSITIKEIFSKDSSIDAVKTYVKVGKLRLIQIAAGIAFTQQPVSTTTIDTTGGGFKVSSSDNRAAAIFGFKIYPFKNYNRDNGLIPRYPLRRISAFTGFEIIHPLNNFFLGGSYDIVPGLAFSYGGNLYLQTNYTLQNGSVINTARNYKWSGSYYSVAINPTLFVQFVKLFFK
jgi:hypothetical protein